MIIGSHVSFGSDQLLGSVKEALSYKANTFMFYTGAPQNTLRKKIDENLTKEAKILMEENGIDIKNVICHAPYIINLANKKDEEKWKFSIHFLEQELSIPVNALELHDFLELVKLGHFEISDDKVQKAIKYYNFISNSNINSIDEIKCSSDLEIEKRLTKRMMERKKIKSEEAPIYYYLCRHGETNWNVEKRIKGQLETIDTEFTERGIKQIETLATFIESNNVQAIFSSDLSRTVETARIVNNKINVPLYFYNKFRGLNMGDFQGKSIDCFLNDDYVKECFKDYNLVIPGGESINQLISRFKDGMDIIRNKYNYDRVSIISHGAAISNIKSSISGDKYENIDYCVLKYYNNNYEIVEYGNYN